ncbi:MAG: hypothetical protein ABW184_08400 [Sphingobium sp.]
MARGNAVTFLSGRLLSLILLMAFQLLVVRVLPPVEYGRFAIVFAFAVLMQTVMSFGVPRLTPKYVGQAGWTLAPRTVRRLVIAILSFRLIASIAAIIVGLVVARMLGWIDWSEGGYILPASAYVLVSVLQVDTDAMALALGLQQVSRFALVGEAALRVIVVAVTAGSALGGRAEPLLWISTTTGLIAVLVLLISVIVALRRMPANEAVQRPLDRSEFRSIALSGHASGMAWFASSPSTIRLIAGRYLGVVAFAGFSFMQTLAVSFQRYTPGMLVLPFVEPEVMRHYARTGDRSRLEAVLSLVVKIDLIAIGAAVVGTMIAGESVVSLMTGGRYVAQAYALPWLLAYLVTMSAYRAFEIVAVVLNASAALTRTLSLSILWIAAAIWLTPRFGLVVLLICPVADSISRLALMQRALASLGVKRAIDLPIVALLCGLILAFGLGGRAISMALGLPPLATLGLGTVAGAGFLIVAALVRPLRTTESELAARGGSIPRALAMVTRD